MSSIAHLPHRGVLELTGAERVPFLNGLVSNDVARAGPGRAVWAALLTPQGKYLVDFFILSDGERLLLDLPRAEIPALAQKLRRMKLRSAVEIKDVSEDLHVYAVWGGRPPQIPLTAADPRLPEAGYRCLAEALITANATPEDYAAHRIGLGLPDGPPDLEPEKSLLLEAGFEELGGVDFEKGCYMGQELTARTKYRGLIKRRLLPVRLATPGLPPGTPILAEGQEVGTLRSSAGDLALATLRLDALGKALEADGTQVTPLPMSWIRLPSLS
ncbi:MULTISPECIES: folate-binding protein YgfZ [unclassified Acidocella]|uniref:CAF17-like 4Fe-4S cluster assembly/insertion protein YgfZ n=1 Tax=unclassified Acidocella TaxID=2648610 RepID=UPI00028D64D5|nr:MULTISPECIES: folate-binding protein YgfZ [unclassified Acidocella]EKM98836.1 glycine cleavage system protein T [Acidocella sp. MX-AZ02]WBO58712.1 folate-binding protein YgfZ [Acidocella sp. MX-AZ03]